jgi:hypothetical protein
VGHEYKILQTEKHETSRVTWQDDSKLDLRKIGYKDVNIVMNPVKAGIFLMILISVDCTL